MVRHLLCVAALSGALVVPLAGGCSDTVSEESKTKVKDDGTVVREKEKVTKDADGNVTKTETKTVDKPGDDDEVKIKVDKD